MNKKLSTVLLFLLLLFTALPIYAGNVENISANKGYTGYFEKKNDEDIYTFTSGGGEYVILFYDLSGRVLEDFGTFSSQGGKENGSFKSNRKLYIKYGPYSGTGITSPKTTFFYPINGNESIYNAKRVWVKRKLGYDPGYAGALYGICVTPEYKSGKKIAVSFHSEYKGKYKFKVIGKKTAQETKTTLTSRNTTVDIQPEIVYTGKAQKPPVTVKCDGKTLRNGTDYEVSYSNNIYVGTATATVKGKGKYKGTLSCTFYIKPSEETFKVTATISTSGAKASGEYSDSFFRNSSVKENIPLMKISALAAASTYADSTEQLLTDAGFENVEKKYTGPDGGGTSADNDHCTVYSGVRMSASGKRIIAVVVDGYSALRYEWISNANLGSGTVHAGFDKAAKEAVSYIETKYAPKEGKDIVWLTGHSRGAAVVNLAAGFIKGEVFAYAFATPNVSTSVTASKRIVNIINEGDCIAYLPLREWGFGKNGLIYTFDGVPDSNPYYADFTGKISYVGMSAADRKEMVGTVNQICGNTLYGYYRETIDSVSGKTLVLAEYMKALGQVRVKRTTTAALGIKTMLEYSIVSPLYAKLTSFFLKGSNMRLEVMGAHEMEMYLAWVMGRA